MNAAVLAVLTIALFALGPWGEPLAYEVVYEVNDEDSRVTEDARVTSAGPDGLMGTADDISFPED